MEMKIEIRLEQPKDYFAVECLVRNAFWDLMSPGCDEHLLAHKMRSSPLFVPQLDFIAEIDGKIVGNILYTGSWVEDGGGNRHEVLTFGPLSVLPEYQRQGIGSALLRRSLAEARSLGYRAVLIFGHPEYYPCFGFQEASAYSITTADGKNFAAFMALELYEGALNGISGRCFLDPVYEQLSPEEVEAFDKRFPPREKSYAKA